MNRRDLLKTGVAAMAVCAATLSVRQDALATLETPPLLRSEPVVNFGWAPLSQIMYGHMPVHKVDAVYLTADEYRSFMAPDFVFMPTHNALLTEWLEQRYVKDYMVRHKLVRVGTPAALGVDENRLKELESDWERIVDATQLKQQPRTA